MILGSGVILVGCSILVLEWLVNFVALLLPCGYSDGLVVFWICFDFGFGFEWFCFFCIALLFACEFVGCCNFEFEFCNFMVVSWMLACVLLWVVLGCFLVDFCLFCVDLVCFCWCFAWVFAGGL